MFTITRHSYHLDRRAAELAQLIEADGNPSDLFVTPALAGRFGNSRSWLDEGARHNFGPPWTKLGVRRVYRREAVVAWLRDRANRFAAAHPAAPDRGPRPTLIME
jgi:hypothetical protein